MENNTASEFFIGPMAENADIFEALLNVIFKQYIYWRRNYYPCDKATSKRNNKWFRKLDDEIRNLQFLLKENYPIYSPRYMAHMLSETVMPGMLGYFAGMLYNANNVTEEAGPVTVNMELEFGKKICQMLGYKKDNKPSGWAHICSGGSIANLESLWLAREIQFIPLIIQEFCNKFKINDFLIETPNSIGVASKNIANLDKRTLLSLTPNEKIFLTTKLIEHLIKNKKMTSNQAIIEINKHIKESKYSVRWSGLINVILNIGLKPVIFIPESAHYSWDKTVSILGYGNTSIRRIPINSKFRIDTKKLKEMLNNLKDDEFIVAVITVVGTTEEGAVDPVHKVVKLREEFEKEKNMSFWLHIDSAWGGFIRSLFNVDGYKDILDKNFINENFVKEFQENIKRIEAKNKTITQLDKDAVKAMILMNVQQNYIDDKSFYNKNITKKEILLKWNDLNVIKAFLSFKEADSITIDPHKLGYIPYPAGVIAFKNPNALQFISQEASYISKVKNGVEKISLEEVISIGPYIIEGSKPGASAVACWFSEKTIPFNIDYHGAIIKNTLLNSKRFSYFITKLNEDNIANSFGIKNRNTLRLYKLVRLYDNIDTNLICFFILPMVWNKDNKNLIKDVNINLKQMNELNEKIYNHFTIINESPHSINFFLSRTRLTSEHYSCDSLKNILSENDIKPDEYKKEGLFALRTTLMNPWYYRSNSNNIDYYFEFFKELNEITLKEINNI